MISVVMLSGGIDSVALLIKQLTETDNLVHAHHIILKNCDNRWEAENKAVKDTIDYCRNNYRRFGFTCSTHQFPDFRIGYSGMDIVTVGFVAGDVVRAIQNQFGFLHGKSFDAEALISTSKTEFPGGMEEIRSSDRTVKAKKMFQNHFTDYKKSNLSIPKFRYPFINKTKKQIYEYIPDELMDKVWTCRTPTYIGDTAVACGMCPACQRDFDARDVK